MIGDNIHIKPEYYRTAEALWDQMQAWGVFRGREKAVVAIGGESGSGKSVASMCLQRTAFNDGMAAFVVHQDDYFRKPPRTNHAYRMAHLDWVGPQEVQLDVLQRHLDAFRMGAETLEKPLVNYRTDEILVETVQMRQYPLLIVEGTYAMQLEGIDVKVFIDRTYQDTKRQRMERDREPNSRFLERVLELEHGIIAPGKQHAHLVVGKDYRVVMGPRDYREL